MKLPSADLVVESTRNRERSITVIIHLTSDEVLDYKQIAYVWQEMYGTPLNLDRILEEFVSDFLQSSRCSGSRAQHLAMEWFLHTPLSQPYWESLK